MLKFRSYCNKIISFILPQILVPSACAVVSLFAARFLHLFVLSLCQASIYQLNPLFCASKYIQLYTMSC
jgi:hypothetical protein